MKKSYLLKFFVVLSCFFILRSSYAQNPTYIMEIKNDSLISPTEYIFDIYIRNTSVNPTWATTFQLQGIQVGVKINGAVLNTGDSIVPTIVAGFSDMVYAQQHTNANLSMSGLTAGAPNANYGVKMTIKAATLGNGTMITTTEMRVCRIKLTTKNQPYKVGTKFNPTWSFTTTPWQTKVSAFLPGGTDITVQANHIITNIRNPLLNTSPVKYNVTGTGSYCQGSGANIGLSNSETGVKYQLFKDNVALGNIVKGTGSALVWANNTVGIYKVIAYRTATQYSDTMIGSAVLTETVLLANAGTISGMATVCQGYSVTYNVPTITDATSYIWTLPSGATGVSDSNSIIANFGSNAQSGNVTVKVVNACGVGDSTMLSITVNTMPSIASAITGLTTVCQGQSNVIFTIPAISNATSYIWSLPNGDIDTTASNSKTFNFSPSFTSGILTVKGNNACGDGIASFLTITANPLLGIADSIIGLSTICPNQNSVIYSIPSIINATSYIWTLPSGATGVSDSNNIVVNFSNNALSGNISVKGINSCGESNTSSLFVNVMPLPSSGIPPLIEACSSATITANAGYTYLWSNGATTQSITVNQSGWYKCNINNANCSVTDSTNVIINNQPRYFCELRNDEQTSANTYEFDIYLLNDNPCVPLIYASGAYGITLNPAITNGGSISVSIISGSSQLNTNQQPTSISYTASQNAIKILPKAAPIVGSSTIIPVDSLGVRVCRVKVTNSQPFAANTANLKWSFTTTPYQSKINAYLNNINTLLVADTNTHTTHHMLNPVFQALTNPISASVNRNNFCKNDTSMIVLSVIGGSGNYIRWYKDSCGGAIIGQGNPITIIAPDSTTTYYARWEMGINYTNCVSVTVNSTLNPPKPVVTIINNCGYSVLSANGYSGNLLWSTGETTANITTNSTNQITVNQTKNGCISDNTFIMPEPKIIPPAIGSNYTVDNYCGISRIQITSYNGSLNWSTNETSNTLFVNNSGYYSVTQTLNGCVSPATDIYAEPLAIPAAPIVLVDNLCGSTLLTVSNQTGILNWTNGMGSGNPITVEQGSFSVYQVVNGCSSEITTVTANPKTIPQPPHIIVHDTCGFSVLTASNYSGSLLWSTNDTSESIISSIPSNYYIKQIIDGCSSINYYANSNPINIPSPPTATVTDLCDSSLLNATSFYGNLIWSTGSSSSSIYVHDTDFYSIRQNYNGCLSDATELFAQPIPSLLVSLSVTENINHVCKGNQIEITANPQNGGDYPLYHWYKNNQLVSNGIDSIYSYSVQNNDNIYCVLTSSLSGCLSNQHAVSNTIGILVDNPPKYSDIKLYLEGFYNQSEQMMVAAMNDSTYQFGSNISDHITLMLAEPYFPYLITDTFDLALQTNGRLIFDVPCWINGYHYLRIKSRNHLETWSMHAISFDSDSIYYDFSTSADKAAGENQKQVSPGIFAIFVGDVNQDGVVDISDLVDMDADITNGTLGYIIYDLNGDGVVDISDLVTIDENITTGAVVYEPYVTLACANTTNVSEITTSAATVSGNISCDGSAIITERGICYSTSTNPTIANAIVINGNGLGSFSCNLTGLTSNTTYYLRVYATNSAGTAYSNEISFKTLAAPVYDIDGNGYDTVKIGNQTWLKQNLKTTKYRNGDAIPNVTDNNLWSNLTTGAYCNYNNDTNIANTYGRLYNWYTVNTANLCPIGWHVPSDAEWDSLTNYLGGESVAGGKLKEAGLSHWQSPNIGATNESGFTALPGGVRSNAGIYYFLNYLNGLWSITEFDQNYSIQRVVYAIENYVFRGSDDKKSGFSVRCLKGDLATLTTDSITGITQTTAISGGNITSDGGLSVTEKGVCWSTSSNPTIALTTKTTDGTGTGSFISNISGLAAGTTYFVRAYATNIAGTAYGNEISFTTTTHIYPVFDIDGNGYDTVQIGTQIWMKQNLKTTKYRNGNAIPNITDGSAWSILTTGAYCNYNNDTNIANTYGRLYNWYTVNDSRNLCPTSWHVPSDAEWTTLTTYLGGEGIAGGKLKEAGLSHWNSPNIGATNETGFTALPGGDRQGSNGGFYNIGNSCYLWSSTDNDTVTAWFREIWYDYIGVFINGYYDKKIGFSVRCLKGDLSTLASDSISGITQTSAICGGNITSDGGLTVTARGVCWSTAPNPTISLSTKTTDGTGTGSFTSNITGLTAGITYYVRAYATNDAGTAYGNEISFTTLPYIYPVYDIDGNGYDTVHIGTQVWMKQNLKTSRFRNGIPIQKINSYSWLTISTSGYGWYDKDSSTHEKIYGKLYNFYAVADTQSICPIGWHVPSDAEWTELSNYLGGENIAGGKLKEVGNQHWNSPNFGASNEYGFTALPGASMDENDNPNQVGGSAYSVGSYGSWWSSTDFSANKAFYRYMSYSNSILFRNSINSYTLKQSGMSVRCLKGDLATLTTDSITGITQTTAICGGNITSDGGLTVTARGVCWSTSPNPTIALTTKTTDGASTGIFISNISGLVAGTTYFVRAYATNIAGTAYGNEVSFTTTPIFKVYDIDGNAYDTVHIGTQVWLKQNLNTSRYRTGAAIPNVSNNTTWANLSTGARCYYNNDSITYANTYGALYNWYAVNTGNLCPSGWHVPTDAEWTSLTTYLGGEVIAGGKLKATTLWNSPNTGATNSSGFTALPGGYRYNNGSYNLIGDYGYWWSSTESSPARAWYRTMGYYHSNASRSSDYKADGFSVRCLRDF